MFKAIKDNKIIAINDSGEFPCLVYDSIEEDTEHSVSDYMQVNGEYVLTSSAEAIEQKKNEVRAERDRRLDAMRWRIERYQMQTSAGIDTTDDAETYHAILLYCQYLRDIPQGAGEWWNAPILTFEEWKSLQTTNNNDVSLE